MRKILIISYFYSPANFVGARRVESWVKHLPENGFFPIVVTRQWNENQKDVVGVVEKNELEIELNHHSEVHRVPHKNTLQDRLAGTTNPFKIVLRKIATLFGIITSYFFINRSKFGTIYKEACKILNEQNDIEYVVVSGRPFESFFVGYLLKKKYPSVKWIPDYRDEWNSHQNPTQLEVKTKFIASLKKYKERQWTKNADAIISVSPEWTKDISRFVTRPGYVVMNGFELPFEDLNKTLSNKLVLTYAGTIYESQRIELVIKHLIPILDKYKDAIEVRFIGTETIESEYFKLREFQQKYPGQVILKKRMPEEQLKEEFAETDVCLITGFHKVAGWYPVKLFTYLKYCKPVISYPNDNSVIDQLIEDCNSGYVCADGNEFTLQIEHLIHEKQNFQAIKYEPIQDKIESFTRKNQAKIFAQVLSEIKPIENTDNLKKVLFFAYDFPPYHSVGTMRPVYWTKNFIKHGYHPTVVTRNWNPAFKDERDYVVKSKVAFEQFKSTSDYKIVYTPYKETLANKLLLKHGANKFTLVRKVLTALNEISQFLFPVGNKRIIYSTADNLCKAEKFDLIVATGDPFVLFHYASKLSKKHGIPWVADYRDPWSQDESIKNTSLYRRIMAMVEKRIVPSASFVSVVSPFMKHQLNKLMPQLKIEVIPNGFNESVVNKIPNIAKNEQFTIAIAGTIYPWNPIDSFLKGVVDWKNKTKTNNFKIEFIGLNESERFKKEWSEKYPSLLEHLIILPKMPYEESLLQLKKAHLLLLFNYFHHMGTKIFDYIGLNQKILFCFTEDKIQKELYKRYLDNPYIDQPYSVQEQILRSYDKGIIVKDTDDLATILTKEYSLQNEISDNSEHKQKNYEFSRDVQLQKLITSFNQLLNQRGE